MPCSDCHAEYADCLTRDRVRVCESCLYERTARERDELREEVVRLTRERDEARAHAYAAERDAREAEARAVALLAIARERDELRAEVARLKSERDSQNRAIDDCFDEINALFGRPEWEYPGQVVRDVRQALRERDALMARVSTLEHALKGLLLLRDAAWTGGHDWNEAVDQACKALGVPEENQ